MVDPDKLGNCDQRIRGSGLWVVNVLIYEFVCMCCRCEESVKISWEHFDENARALLGW